MKNEQILPTILVVLNIACCVPYAAKGDWRHTIYWAASAILISAVTF